MKKKSAKKPKPPDVLVGKRFEVWNGKRCHHGVVVAKASSRYVVRMTSGIFQVVTVNDMAGWILYEK